MGSNGKGKNATGNEMAIDTIEAEASEGEMRGQPHDGSVIVGNGGRQGNRIRVEMHDENDSVSVTQRVEGKVIVRTTEYYEFRAE